MTLYPFFIEELDMVAARMPKPKSEQEKILREFIESYAVLIKKQERTFETAVDEIASTFKDTENNLTNASSFTKDIIEKMLNEKLKSQEEYSNVIKETTKQQSKNTEAIKDFVKTHAQSVLGNNKIIDTIGLGFKMITSSKDDDSEGVSILKEYRDAQVKQVVGNNAVIEAGHTMWKAMTSGKDEETEAVEETNSLLGDIKGYIEDQYNLDKDKYMRELRGKKKEKKPMSWWMKLLAGLGLGMLGGMLAKYILLPFQMIMGAMKLSMLPVTKIIDFFGRTVTRVTTLLSDRFGSFGKMVDSIKDKFKVFRDSFANIGKALKESKIGKMFPAIATAISDKLAGITGAIKNSKILTSLKTVIGPFFKYFKMLWAALNPFLPALKKGLQIGFKYLGWPLTVIMGIIDFVKGFASSDAETFTGKIADGLKRAIEEFIEMPLKLIGWLTDKFLGLFGVKVEGGIAEWLEGAAKSGLDKIFAFGTLVIDAFFLIPKKIWGFVTESINDFKEGGFKGLMNSIWEKFKSIPSTIFDWITTEFEVFKLEFPFKMGEVWNKLKSIPFTILDWITGNLLGFKVDWDEGFKGLTDKILSLPTDIIDWLGDTYEEFEKSIVEAFKKLFDWILDIPSRIKEGAEKVATTVVGESNVKKSKEVGEGFKAVIKNKGDAAKMVAEKGISGVAEDTVTFWGDVIKNISKEVINKTKDIESSSSMGLMKPSHKTTKLDVQKLNNATRPAHKKPVLSVSPTAVLDTVKAPTPTQPKGTSSPFFKSMEEEDAYWQKRTSAHINYALMAKMSYEDKLKKNPYMSDEDKIALISKLKYSIRESIRKDNSPYAPIKMEAGGFTLSDGLAFLHKDEIVGPAKEVIPQILSESKASGIGKEVDLAETKKSISKKKENMSREAIEKLLSSSNSTMVNTIKENSRYQKAMAQITDNTTGNNATSISMQSRQYITPPTDIEALGILFFNKTWGIG